MTKEPLLSSVSPEFEYCRWVGEALQSLVDKEPDREWKYPVYAIAVEPHGNFHAFEFVTPSDLRMLASFRPHLDQRFPIPVMFVDASGAHDSVALLPEPNEER